MLLVLTSGRASMPRNFAPVFGSGTAWSPELPIRAAPRWVSPARDHSILASASANAPPFDPTSNGRDDLQQPRADSGDRIIMSKSPRAAVRRTPGLPDYFRGNLAHRRRDEGKSALFADQPFDSPPRAGSRATAHEPSKACVSSLAPDGGADRRTRFDRDLLGRRFGFRRGLRLGRAAMARYSR